MKIAYIRVSTNDQNTARQLAAMESVGIDKFYEEKVSGKNMDRPQLKQMLELDQAEFAKVCRKWRTGEITAVKAMKILGISRNTFYRRLKEYEKDI